MWTKKDAWTSLRFVDPLNAFLREFTVLHSWASEISVVERFHNPGIHRRAPFGAYGRAEDPRAFEEGFRSSDAPALLVFTAVRAGDGEQIEVALTFPDGPLTDAETLDFKLAQASQAMDSEEARRPLA